MTRRIGDSLPIPARPRAEAAKGKPSAKPAVRAVTVKPRAAANMLDLPFVAPAFRPHPGRPGAGLFIEINSQSADRAALAGRQPLYELGEDPSKK